jgi:hypothetical protein
MINLAIRNVSFITRLLKVCIYGRRRRDKTKENAERMFQVRVGTDMLKKEEIEIYTT